MRHHHSCLLIWPVEADTRTVQIFGYILTRIQNTPQPFAYRATSEYFVFLTLIPILRYVPE